MNQDTAGSRAAPDDAPAGASRPAGRAGPAAQRYEVRPVGWVQSPLKHRAQAPRQGSEGAPPAWLAVEPDPVVAMPRRNAAMSRPNALRKVLEEFDAGLVKVPSKNRRPPWYPLLIKFSRTTRKSQPNLAV